MLRKMASIYQDITEEETGKKRRDFCYGEKVGRGEEAERRKRENPHLKKEGNSVDGREGGVERILEMRAVMIWGG